MGQFDKFLDSPGRINSEGKNIELSFQRTSDTTARISWNIPSPSSGCNSSNQAYDGIVITVSNKPANYLTTSPKDGNYYSGDATVDPDLSTGDKLDGALVVGAFYNDKTTSFLDVTELTPKTAYYFSGYAVDNVARYYKEGVHSYSLPTGPEKANTEIDLPAIQDVGIETGDGIGPNTFTGLKQGQNYVITVLVNGKKYKLKINGTLALDYDDLVYHINQEFIRLTEDKFTSPYPPNTNAYYIDVPHQKIYQWDGYKSNIAEALFQNDDPSVPLDGTYWYNPDNAELSLYAGGWNQVPYTLATFDFSNPQCYQFWFDGTTNVYKWEKVLWCLLPTYISDVNPLLPPPLDCNSFWYNTATSLISQWDIQTASWNNIN
ncbi:MAG: hypothetical protein JWP44_5032, partial [Mucilaginibacter sp.]|nr:hypothetical protein [Mucilaginibacter sp.]